MDFGPFGLSEVVFIGLLALVLFGPRRLPELMRSVGSVLTTLRRGTEDLRRSFQQELDKADGGATRELRDAATTLRSAGEDVRNLSRDAVQQGRRLLEGEGSVGRPGRPEPAAPKTIEAPAGGESKEAAPAAETRAGDEPAQRRSGDEPAESAEAPEAGAVKDDER